jgi:hypothetical protein
MSFTSIAPGVINLLTRSAGTREPLRGRSSDTGEGGNILQESALPALTITDKLQLLRHAAGIPGTDFAAIFKEEKPLDPYDFLRKRLSSRESSERGEIPNMADSGK